MCVTDLFPKLKEIMRSALYDDPGEIQAALVELVMLHERGCLATGMTVGHRS